MFVGLCGICAILFLGLLMYLFDGLFGVWSHCSLACLRAVVMICCAFMFCLLVVVA